MTALIYPPTQNGLQKTLGAQLNTGTTSSATLNSVTGIQNKPGMMLIDRVDANGIEKDPSLREYVFFTGTSGSTVTTLVRGLAGSTDQTHANGAIVEFVPDVVWAQSIIDSLANLVDTTTLAVDTTKVVTPSGTQTLTNKDISSGTNTFPTTVLTTTGTQTVTNKRNTRRVVSTTQSATPTINTDNTDVSVITGLAQAITSMTTNLSGTPVNGDSLIISITDNGTARAITWGASFESSGNVTLPTTTVLGVRLDVGFLWNTVTSKWRCVGIS